MWTYQTDNFEFPPLYFIELISLFQLIYQTSSFSSFSFKRFDIFFHPLHTDAKFIEKIIRLPTFFETGSQSVNLSNLDLSTEHL